MMNSRVATRRTKTRKPIFSSSFAENIASFWFLLPILVVFAVLTLIPLVQSFYYSLTDFNGYNNNFHFIGFANYVHIFRTPEMLTPVGFTLFYSVVLTLIVTMLAIPLAVTLNRAMWGRSFARSLFFFLGIPAQAIIGLIWRFIFSSLDTGVINGILHKFGFKSILWLSVDNWARFAVIFVSVWMAVGWHATLYLAYLQTIPKDLYEQARVDGASQHQQFVHITLPQLTPGIVVSTFLLMTSGLKVYDLPFTLTQGGPGYATQTITQSILINGITNSKIGLGSALSTLFTIASILIIVLQLGVAKVIARRFQ